MVVGFYGRELELSYKTVKFINDQDRLEAILPSLSQDCDSLDNSGQ